MTLELVKEPAGVTNVYYRKQDGKLGKAEAGKDEYPHHHDAIIAVQELLIAEGVGYDMPVLALIIGGKEDGKLVA